MLPGVNEVQDGSAESLDASGCVLCGGTRFEPWLVAKDYAHGVPGEFTVARCLECGLKQQRPVPTAEQLLQAYRSDYRPFTSETAGLVVRIKHAAINRPRLQRYRRLVPSGGRVLDVGCGNGGLLRFLRERTDWSLTGVEPTVDAATAARATGLDVRVGTLEEAALADSSFDLAILNHVLEHVPSPAATMGELRRVLKRGGYLCGEVPTPACVEQWIFGEYWGSLDLPRHISFFERSTLSRLLVEAGFEIIAIEGKPQPAVALVSLSNFVRARWPSLARAPFLSEDSFVGLALSTPLAFALSAFGSSPTLRFVCRSP